VSSAAADADGVGQVEDELAVVGDHGPNEFAGGGKPYVVMAAKRGGPDLKAAVIFLDREGGCLIFVGGQQCDLLERAVEKQKDGRRASPGEV